MAFNWVGAQQGLGTVSGLMKWTWNAHRDVGHGEKDRALLSGLLMCARDTHCLGRMTEGTLPERAQF